MILPIDFLSLWQINNLKQLNMITKRIIILITLLISIVGFKAFAYDFSSVNADGITLYYNYINDNKELEVTYSDYTNNYRYTGDIVIPEEVTYMSRTRKVTSIGERAFNGCYYLNSVSIPSNVSYIGNSAFESCRDLNTITIPNSVTYIGNSAFAHCWNLKSIAIPNNVTTINKETFRNCHTLLSVAIPNSVTSIGEGAFRDCEALYYVVISDLAAWCNIEFGDSYYSNPLYYAHRLAMNEEIKELVIPQSVTSISGDTFRFCSNLSSVTIHNNVTSIGNLAFVGSDIQTVISQIENPFVINNAFNTNTVLNATLYVPKGTKERYMETEGWNKFAYIEELSSDDNPSENQKCDIPTISYRNGKLSFHSTTEGVAYLYSITNPDIKDGIAQEVQLGVTYIINVYATKEGYENSETATATLCWIDVEPKSEGLSEGMTQVSARAVMVKAEGGDGVLVGSNISKNGIASINTTLSKDSTAIVKIGNKSVKVIMR